ncbi:MAG: glycosyltransferase family 39 protein [Chloroflexota bacterium]
MKNRHDQRSARIRFFISLAGILLVFAGQFILFALPGKNPDAIPTQIWISGVGLVLFLGSLVFRPPGTAQSLPAGLAFSKPAMLVGAAATLSLSAALAMMYFYRSSSFNYIPVITLWLASGICYVAAFAEAPFTPEAIREWIKAHRNELLLLAGLTLVAAFLRFYELGNLPRVLDGDEGRLGEAAQATVADTWANPFSLWENFGALYLQAVNIAIEVFGPTPLALRFLPAVSGTLAIPMLYLLARQVAGKRTALIATFLLMTSHTHIHFSRIGAVGYIHGTWLVPLELYLLLSGLEKRSAWRTAAAGVLLAIHFSVYLTAQIITGLALAYMLVSLLFLRPWFRPALKQSAAFWGGWVLLLLPEVAYVAYNPNEFINRLGENGTFQTGWLAETIANTGQSAMSVLSHRVAHAFLSLTYYPAFDFYGSRVPMLSLITAALFLIGLGVALWRARSPGHLLLNGYFWAPTLAIGLFAIPPSADSYRMIIVLPPAMLLAAIGLEQTLDALGVSWENTKQAYALVAAGVLASLLVFNVWAYYGDFAGQCRYGDNLPGRFASHMGKYVGELDNAARVYLLSNDLFFYGSHHSAAFLSQGRKIINVPEPADSLDLISGETVLANPDRIAELEAWARSHPGGQLHYLYDCKTVIMLAYRAP